MSKADIYLRESLIDIFLNGTFDSDVRARYKDGEPAITKFVTHKTFEYDLQNNEFPIPTLRPTAIKTAIKEVLWIYQKQNSSLKTARKLGINWWDSWNIGDDTIGKRYGATVSEYDIIRNILYDLENNKFSRRHIIDLYQYKDFKETIGLHPCVFLSMFAVREVGNINYLDLMVVSRSSDFITAGFINQIQYVALQMMICGHLNYETQDKWEIGKFTFVVNNLHTYLRHEVAVIELLDRESLCTQPTINLKENKNFFEYEVSDFKIEGVSEIEPLLEKLELAI